MAGKYQVDYQNYDDFSKLDGEFYPETQTVTNKTDINSAFDMAAQLQAKSEIDFGYQKDLDAAYEVSPFNDLGTKPSKRKARVW